MKRLKNKKRTNQMEQKEHKHQWEYSPAHSSPDQTVFICTAKTCDGAIVEHEDAGTGA